MPDFPESVGPYKILSKLGQGGMGTVFRAHDQRLDRAVALKAVPTFQSDPALRHRSWQEARAAARVAHPNACRLYDILEENDQLFLVMELIEGESLACRLRRGPLPIQEAAQTMLNILSALEAFHRAGIVHRDLKPSNIVLSPQGTKVLDFGLAKETSLKKLDPEGSTLTSGTSAGTFLGTPRYASPEQFLGESADERSDVFSLGVVFFEMLTGETPFTGESFVDIAHAVLHGSPPALTGSPAIAAFSRIIHTAMARQRPDRYQSAESMAADIRAALAIEGVESRIKARRLRR
ncbi:MAG TPA: serine/threonine-protein kinase, partial [Candidatus Angelobacter sp.]|nr:serine/threonine-protein kinase [Candidatus Angelobacter sp.]